MLRFVPSILLGGLALNVKDKTQINVHVFYDETEN